MKKIYFLTIILLSLMVLYSCGSRKIVSETVDIQSFKNTSETLNQNKNDKLNDDANQIVLFEKEGYKYTLIKCDKDAIDGVIAKIKYENNSDNKNLNLELSNYNINGLDKDEIKFNPIYLEDGGNLYNVNYRYNDFFDELYYIELNLEAKVNGRVFKLKPIIDGNLDDGKYKVVKFDTKLYDKEVIIKIIDNRAFCQDDITIDGTDYRQRMDRKHYKTYDSAGNEIQLFKFVPFIECTRKYDNYMYEVKYFPENKTEVLEILDENKEAMKNELKQYPENETKYKQYEKWCNDTKDFINEFDSKVGKFYESDN